ncbi:hypothetical protein DUNSADRAFT_5013 [Dunaliella salina]|uniref:Encoded protein n=1 Tax=Dunaliella salina TaxID=3046 RepID=A0ABQ7GQW3_DUNSA|nr:hypothetical protein DUNSADRAFT_5013 [Dunaliella salina]|eukprot:KAF5836991.1 hypothetical protein DUNSADRAFT_5013 [Dunaliella salina]
MSSSIGVLCHRLSNQACLQHRALPCISSLLQGMGIPQSTPNHPQSSSSSHSFPSLTWTSAQTPCNKVPDSLTSSFNSMSLYLQALNSNDCDDH